MTQEQIVAIREAQLAENKYKEKQRIELESYHINNVVPLLSVCDHKYPWGDSAMRRDTTMSYAVCDICGASYR